jgi:hypothetical protein
LPARSGCLDGQLGWLSEMSGFLKGIAPQQLVMSGTEGFFVPESGSGLHLLNPGAPARPPAGLTVLSTDVEINVRHAPPCMPAAARCRIALSSGGGGWLLGQPSA